MAQNKKYLYAIKNLKIENWIKWWLLRKGSIPADYVLGELMTGTDITIDNTVEKKFFKFDIKGNSTQETTTGKNMYEGSPNWEGTWSNDSLWETADETFNGYIVRKRKGVWGGLSKDINVTAGETYTFSLYVKSTTARQTSIYLAGGTATVSPSSKDITTSTSWQRVSITFTVSASGTIKPRLENISASDTNTTYIACYQLEKSSTMTDYEPYTNGASPNPSYPQEIYSAGDDGSISEKIVNKNLYDIEQYPLTLNRALDTTTGNFYQTSSGNYYGVLSYIPFSQFVSKTLAINTTLIVAFYDKDKNYIGYIKPLTPDKTVPNGTAFIRLECGKDYINEIQIEIGSTATNFVAHQEQTYTIPCQQPMRSIGDVRDEFIKINGNWFERHNLGFKTNITNWQSGGVTGVYYTPSIIDYAISDNIPLCNYYVGVNNVTGASNMGTQENQRVAFINKSGSETPRFYVKDTSITNLGEWVSSHNLKIVYVLATPQDLPCTEEQINILENLPKSYNEQTNIYSLDVTPAFVEAQSYVKKEGE